MLLAVLYAAGHDGRVLYIVTLYFFVKTMTEGCSTMGCMCEGDIIRACHAESYVNSVYLAVLQRPLGMPSPVALILRLATTCTC